MPTEYPACRETDNDGSNSGVGAPWIKPASRSASEPETASLHQVRVANLSDVPKPEIRREVIFICSGGTFRGKRGQRAGKVGLGSLGDPCCRLRHKRDKVHIESIRWALGVWESERPVVAMKQGNACGAKGPWRGRADSEGDGTDWSNPITEQMPSLKSDAAIGSQIPMSDECSKSSTMRKPDAGNPHVRFEEGEGTRRSLALPLIPCVPLYSTSSYLSRRSPAAAGRRRIRATAMAKFIAACEDLF